MSTPEASLQLMLRSLKLPSFVAQHEEISAQADRHGWTFSQALRQLCELELHDRRERRIERLMRASGLPSDKTLATLEQKRLPAKVRRQLPTLCEGGRRDDGIVIRGAKVHQTGAANSHQILVMPGQGLREGEEDFAVACALPVDAPGVRMVLGRQPSDERKGGPDAGNARFGGQECVVLFDDVFVPSDRVFLDGNLAACATLVDAFAGFHRASYGGCKPGNLDVLIGAADLVAREHGVRRASHVRDKLVEMTHLTETVHGVGLAASAKSTQHGSGIWQVDPILANVCKHNVTRVPYEVTRLAEDLAGGAMSTLPSLAALDHPELGDALRGVYGSHARARGLRLLEYMTYGSGSVPLRIECMHGAGSPQAQRIVLERTVDWEAKVKRARVLAGLDEDDELSLA